MSAWKIASRSSPLVRMPTMTAPTSRAMRPMSSGVEAVTVIVSGCGRLTMAPLAACKATTSKSASGVLTTTEDVRGVSSVRGRALIRSTVVDDDCVVGTVGHLGHEVAGQEDRPTGVGEPPQEDPQRVDAIRIEPVEGLVEDEDLRVSEESS